MTCRINTLRDVVVATRREQSIEAPSRRIVVGARLLDREPDAFRQRQGQQRVEIALEHHQFRSAVGFHAAIVSRQVLRAIVRADDIPRAHMANAVRGHVDQVLLDDCAESSYLRLVHRIHDAGKIGGIVRNGLATPANSIRPLDANRAEFKQFAASQQRVSLGEHADAVQHDSGDAAGKLRAPARRRIRRDIE